MSTQKIALPGVAIHLSYFDASGQKNDLAISENGFIGKLQPGKVGITIITDETKNPLLSNLIAYQQRRPSERSPWQVHILSDGAKENQKERVFRFSVQINVVNQTTQEKFKPESYPGNNIKLALIGSAGTIEIWNFGIISQYEKFYFIQEKRCETKAYQVNKEVFCEEFRDHRWKPLREKLTINFQFSGKYNSLPVLNALPAKVRMNGFNARLKDKQAQCTGHSVLQGIGWARTFIDGHEEIVTYHWRTCPNQKGIKRFFPGQIFEYATLSDPPANSRTEFKHQVYHLKLVS